MGGLIRTLARSASSTAALLLWSALSAEPAGPAEFLEVKAAFRSSEQVFLDRRGRPLQERRLSEDIRRLRWARLADVSPALIRAVVRSEDKRFFEHSGTDWLAVGSAALGFASGSSRRGASTITMQLAGLLDANLASGAGGRTLSQKWRQILAARELEGRWSKEQILEAYLNLVSYRGELQGIESAAYGLFGKSPAGLTDLESVVIASLIRSPESGLLAVQKRACRLAFTLKLPADCSVTNPLVERVLTQAPRIRPLADFAPHIPGVVDSSEAEVRTTLDLDLQRAVKEILHKQLLAVRTRNVRDGAVLVIENETGAILAYAGSSGVLSSAPFVDFVRARRQAGSTLKPFVYGEVIERRYLTAASELMDTPLNRSVGTGIYRPENYDGHFLGPISLRIALASSRNIPAVRAIEISGVDSVVNRLELLGFRGLRDSQYYGPSLALGSADVTLWELTGAYRAIANRGNWSPLFAAGHPADFRPAFSPQTAFLIADILSDRESRSPGFGLESVLSTRFWTAVKTGTSKDMRDNWCVGFSDRYTVGVWVGNAGGEPMWNVLGVSGAAPAWLEVMNHLHAANPSQAPQVPPGIVRANVNGREEYFLEGTEPVSGKRSENQPLQIAYPEHESIFALDPDIPPGRQKIFFRWKGSTSGERLVWTLNGRVLGSENPTAWTPVRGQFTLRLQRQCGQRCTETAAVSRFEVR